VQRRTGKGRVVSGDEVGGLETREVLAAESR